jgi:hypothetical protein
MHKLLAAALLSTLGCSPASSPPPAADAPAVSAPQAAPAAPDLAFKPLPDARVRFIEPADGATVRSPFRLVFGVDGAEIRPAGELSPGTGHHHVIVDGAPGAEGEVVPADATHIHYGKGQTEAELALAPGAHTLTMQLADGLHRSYGPSASATIEVTVAE